MNTFEREEEKPIYAIIPTHEENAVQTVLQRLDRKSQGSFFTLVPDEFKPDVFDLAANNHFHYPDFPTLQAFLETMAKNWLAKFYAFGELAQQAGMEIDKTETKGGQEDFYRWAVLTKTASLVLVSSGAFDKSGVGAAAQYQRLPLRESDSLSSMSGGSGTWFLSRPHLGKSAELIGKVQVVTSPVIAIYSGADTQDPQKRARTVQDLHGSINSTFTRINRSTIQG